MASRSKRWLDDACAFRETRVIGGAQLGTGPFGWK